jgi:4,5-DOPA dioxygenase extradiol
VTANSRMPAIFFGHGNPMNAIEVNTYTKAWSRLKETFPRPKAILSVSAHWYGAGTLLTAMDAPRTIHDFGGFPRELFEFPYPAPGDPAFAKRIRELLAPVPAALDDRWGLDHGTWSVLCHLYPDADVPVVQLSIDEIEPASFHFELGRRLAPLREEGVLLIGSGNVVHNLHAYAWGRHPTEPFDWAVRFEQRVRGSLLAGDDATLVGYESLGPDAKLAAPTPDHYLPLLYVAGARHAEDQVTFPVEGIDGGSVSMLTAKLG